MGQVMFVAQVSCRLSARGFSVLLLAMSDTTLSDASMQKSTISTAPTGSNERSGLSEPRRRELADFLRTRREKLKPEQVGITQVSRRRTPGLRREEVAEIAGVGTTWYTWLEQARDIQPSAEVLKRLSHALAMNPAETKHLFTLAGRAAPVEIETLKESAPAGLLKVLTSFPMPAMVLGSRWDLLAINKPAQEAFKSLPAVVEANGNWLHFYFLEMNRSAIQNWERNSRQLISDFRLSVSDSLDQPWVSSIVEDLRAKSPEFETLWREHDVTEGAQTLVEVLTDQGVACFERTMMRSAEDPRLKVVFYTQA